MRVYLIRQRRAELRDLGEDFAGDLLLFLNRRVAALGALIHFDVGAQPVERRQFGRRVLRQRVSLASASDQPGLALHSILLGLLVPLEIGDHRLDRRDRGIVETVALARCAFGEVGNLRALVDEPRFRHAPQRRASCQRHGVRLLGRLQRGLQVDQSLCIRLVRHVRYLRSGPVQPAACLRRRAD